MRHFMFNLADGDRERAKSFLHANKVNRAAHSRDTSGTRTNRPIYERRRKVEENEGCKSSTQLF